MLRSSLGPSAKSVTIPVPIANQEVSSLREIALPLVVHANAFGTNAVALSLAKLFDASVAGFAFAFDPILPVVCPMDSIPAEMIEELAARSENEARENAAAFERQAHSAAVPVDTRLVRTGLHEAGYYFASAARSFDISVVPQQKAAAEIPDFAQAALFESGKPVLVVPYIQQAPLSLKRVLVCWDGSRAAARAISDAWPILARADVVNVVTAGHENSIFQLQQSLGQHFAHHGVNARLQSLGVNDIDIGNAILSYAADDGTTLIVMGGYGHSKAREWLLGGATRTVLQTMTVPVLISH